MPLAPRKSNAYAAILIGAFTLFWLWFATTHDLVQDEAYYWQWSRHLDIGYYDGPAMVAYVIRLFTTLLGSTALGVRCGAIVCAAVAAGFLYKLGADLFGEKVGLIALAAALLNPLFGGGATIMTLDPVQLAFWSASCWTIWRAYNAKDSEWGWWITAGILCGLTAESKLNGLLLLPSALLFGVIDRDAFRRLRKPQPYVAALIACALFLPFAWWNQTHANAFWIHIVAMGSRTNGQTHHFTLQYFGDFIGAQAGLVSPLLFLTYLWMLVTAIKRNDATPGLRFVWSMSVVVFVATCFLSLKSRVEANWAVTSYLTGFILVAYAASTAWKSVAGRIWHSLGFALAGIMTLLLYLTTLWAAAPHIAAIDNRTDELYGWKQMAARVQAEQQAMGGSPFVFGTNYRMPSELAFYLPGRAQTYSLFLNDRANEYLFWGNLASLIGRDALMVNDADTADHLDDCRAVFQKVEVQPPLKIYRAPYKDPIRTIQIFRCYGFKGYDRAVWQKGW